MNLRLPRLLILELTIIASGVIAYFTGHVIAQFGELAVILAFSLFLTYALLPVVNFLTRYVWRGVAVGVVYLLLLGVVAGVIALVSVPLAKQIDQLTKDYPRYSQQFHDAVPRVQDELAKRNINVDLEARSRDLTQEIRKTSGDVASKSGLILAKIFGTLTAFFVVLFVTGYFLLSGAKFTEAVIGLFPSRRQRMVRRLVMEYDRILGGFVRGNLLVASIIFVVVSLFCTLVGLPYSVLSGLIAAFTSLIPVIGAFLGVALPVAIAAFVHPVLIPVFLLFFFILNEITHKWLYPKVVGSALELHPLVVLLGLLAGAKMAGIAGALLATPLIALAKETIVAVRNSAGYSRL
jgi:predicted PurR-regulated permease PerM